MKHACTCRRCHRPMEIQDQSDGAVDVEILKKFAVCDDCARNRYFRPRKSFVSAEREYNSPYKD